MDEKKLMKSVELINLNLKFFLKVLELGFDDAILWYELEYERIERDYKD